MPLRLVHAPIIGRRRISRNAWRARMHLSEKACPKTAGAGRHI